MFQKELHLLELIKSLSAADKKYYKLFKTNDGNRTQLLQLFELYSKNSEKTESEIKKKALEFFTEKQYSSIKKELFHSICDIMCFYHRNSLNHLKTYHEIMKINFLISRNIKNEAARYANKLREQLYSNPIQTIIPSLYGVESFVYFENKEKNNFFKILNEHQQVNNTIDCIKELHDSRAYLYVIQMEENNKKNITKKEISTINHFKNYYTKFYTENYIFKSKQAELNHLVSKYLNPNLSLNEKYQIAILQNKLVKNNPSFFTIDALLYSYYNLINASFEINNSSETTKQINELKKCKTLTKAQEKIKLEQVIEVELKFAAMNENYRKVDILCSEFEAYFKTGQYRFLEFYIANIFHYSIFSNVIQGNPSKNKKMILKYSNLFSKKDFPELFETYRILEILTLIELNDYETVAYQIRNAKLSFKENPSLLKLITILDQLRINLENIENINKSQLMKQIEILYEANFRKEKSHLVFQNFNLKEWFKQKLK